MTMQSGHLCVFIDLVWNQWLFHIAAKEDAWSSGAYNTNTQCRSAKCQYPNCSKVKGLFHHGIHCKISATGGCVLCKKMWYLLQLHARGCKESECHVPRCKFMDPFYHHQSLADFAPFPVLWSIYESYMVIWSIYESYMVIWSIWDCMVIWSIYESYK